MLIQKTLTGLFQNKAKGDPISIRDAGFLFMPEKRWAAKKDTAKCRKAFIPLTVLF